MTTKEKANELYNKNYRLFQNTDTCFGDCDEEYKKGNCTNSGHGCGIWFNLSKQCALVAVNELINSIPCIPSPILNENITDSIMQAREFWQEVKNEIEKL